MEQERATGGKLSGRSAFIKLQLQRGMRNEHDYLVWAFGL